MDLYTNVNRFCRIKKIPIAFNSNEKFYEIPKLNERLRIVLVRSGTGILCFGEKRISIIAPAILCINEKEKVRLEDSLNFNAETFYFHPQYINGNLTFEKIRGAEEEELATSRQDIFLFKPFVIRNANYIGIINIDYFILNSISNLFNSIKNEINDQAHRHWSCCARSYFLELLFTLVRIYQSPELKVDKILKGSSALIDKVILYLNSNYARKITITELCSMYNTNKTTLQKQFHNVTGESIISYLINIRVKVAALMLRNTGLTISEIANMIGFSDSTHFNKMFSKLTGYSPLQYRKEFTLMRGSNKNLPI